MRRTDPIIIGGGPAGSAAAILLAKGGAKPTLFERQHETGDALCGGFMSWRTLAALDALGVSHAAVGGHAVRRVRVTAAGRSAEAPLPGGAVGVSRRQLDTLLLKAAEQAGAAVNRGVSVSEVDASLGVRLADGAQIEAETLFLATGKHDLRGLARPKPDTSLDQTLGLRIRLAAHPGLSKLVDDRIDLHLFDRGYAGLVLQEDGSANLCLAVRKSRLTEAGGRPAALLEQIGAENPALSAVLAYMEESAAIDAIAAVPYGWRTDQTVPGVFRLGDQAAVIPSLAGEGNGIAIASGMAAARCWLANGAAGAAAYQADFARRTRRPVTTAHILWKQAERPLIARAAIATLNIAPFLAGVLARMTRIPH